MTQHDDPRLHPDAFWPRLTTAMARIPAEATAPPPDARVGAVLVLLADTPAGPSVVLTRRRKDMRSHPGQLSFPGGRLDDDESVEEAALREAEEEIGLRRDTVEIVARGPRFYIPPSRFWVCPVFARWTAPHEANPNPWEVDEILHIPLATLLQRDRWRHVPLSDRGSTWAWQLDDDILWGATAMVMGALLDTAVEGWSDGLTPSDLDGSLSVRPWETAPAFTPKTRLEGVPEVELDSVPAVTGEQMAQVDRLLAELGLDLSHLVEQAGRGVTHAVRRLVGGDLTGARVAVLVGSGGNGAGGLAAARLLAVAGAEVEVRLTGEPRLPEQVRQAVAAGCRVLAFDADLEVPDVVVDAVLGYGTRPPVQGVPWEALLWTFNHDVPVVALDLPSGMLADGLEGRCVTADITVTIAVPKVAMLRSICQPYLGDLYLVDIGVPASVWEAIGVAPVTAFGEGPLVRLVRGAVATDAGTPDQADLAG